MKIPFFNYQKLYVKNKEAIEEAFFSVMERGAFILQSDLEDFESALAKYTGEDGNNFKILTWNAFKKLKGKL